MSIPSPFAVKPPRKGVFHRWRHTLQMIVVLLLFAAPFINLLRFDIAESRLVLFGTSLPLGELGIVYGLLIFSFLLLFTWALLYGRLFCGWICPQTTVSELAATIDRKVIRKKQSDAFRHVLAGVLKVFVAALFAASAVSYFVPPESFLQPSAAMGVSFAILLVINSANLLFVRHTFCRGICPYGILQSLLQDGKTLGVAMVENPPDKCMKCGCCFNSCFMGIDVRNEPFDAMCLRCGDCVDAGNYSHVHRGMAKMVEFRYGSESTRFPSFVAHLGIRDFKRAATVALTSIVGIGLLFVLLGRQDLSAKVSSDFSQVQVVDNTLVKNVYTVTVANRSQSEMKLDLEVVGLEGIQIEQQPSPILLKPAAQEKFQLVLTANRNIAPFGSHKVMVNIVDNTREKGTSVETRFFIPQIKEK